MNKKLVSTVLDYPRLKSRVGDNSELKEQVLKNLEELSADFSKTTIKIFSKVLDGIVKKLYDEIYLDEIADNDFKTLIKEKNVVLVPNHQSHADYLALNYAFYKKFKHPLFVAGGINLNIFPIGKVFRQSGCFFIRRSFANDILYKLTVEAYLYYLLIEGMPVEFFFEGGRSRTGKLLPPRFGLYSMLIEAHSHIPEDKKRELLFIPISIAHEYVPEQRSLARELGGGAKTKESTKQLYKVLRIFSKQFGTIHMRPGRPISSNGKSSAKEDTQALAFDCFREVGKNMVVTPSSLLCLILLDEPSGALKWEDISARAQTVLDFCVQYNVPLTPSLSGEDWEKALERAIDIFISNKKIDVIGQKRMGHVFYSIKHAARIELLYFKNTILHHFMIPWIINQAWMKVFTGVVENQEDLKTLFLTLRDQLKHEFYLPKVKNFFKKALEIVSGTLGSKVKSIEECMIISKSHKDLYTVFSGLGVFNRSYNYIFEGYYASAITIKDFTLDEQTQFLTSNFLKKALGVHRDEMAHGNVIKFPESYSQPLLKNSLRYFVNLGILKQNGALFQIIDKKLLEDVIVRYKSDLTGPVILNIGKG